MARQISTQGETSSFLDLKERILDLKTARIEGEKEFLGLRGKEISTEELNEIENKYQTLLYRLELDGVQIQQEHIQLLRKRFGDIGLGGAGDLEFLDWCPFCEKCVTSCTECIGCTHCVIAGP